MQITTTRYLFATAWSKMFWVNRDQILGWRLGP
jgi:hypothetical protein